MRIVVTTGTAARHRLFVGMLSEAVGGAFAGVVLQARPPSPPPSTTTALVRRGIARARRHRTPLLALWKPPSDTVEGHLLRLAQPRAPIDVGDLRGVDVLETSDPNDQSVLAWLAAQPDLVLVFGGSILRGAWLTAPRLGAINLHYGALPDYRGGWSTEYALYHDRPDRVGATVHYIDAGVDTGPVIRRVRVDPRSVASLEECKARVYLAGIEALVGCAREIVDRGERLPADPQDAAGHQYRSAEFSPVVELVARHRIAAAHREFPAFHRALAGAPRRRRVAGRLPVGPLAPGLYILLYHSIVDAADASPWEVAFTKVSTSLASFTEQLRFLRRHMTPIALNDAPELFRVRPPERPYVAVTFDDGYTNLLTRAAPLCAELGFPPTVFVNASFAAGRAVHYRVHLAELIQRGKAEETAALFAARFPSSGYDSSNLWSKSKDAYVRGETEAATAEAWADLAGEELDVHLSFEQLRELCALGWSIGNHTISHTPLVGLDADGLEEEVMGNHAMLAAEGLEPIDWISYPYGRFDTTDAAVGRFMDAHPELHGIYASGGVNFASSRAEWARIGVENETARELRTRLVVEAGATLSAWADLAR